jgi:hypothetical protein
MQLAHAGVAYPWGPPFRKKEASFSNLLICVQYTIHNIIKYILPVDGATEEGGSTFSGLGDPPKKGPRFQLCRHGRIPVPGATQWAFIWVSDRLERHQKYWRH